MPAKKRSANRLRIYDYFQQWFESFDGAPKLKAEYKFCPTRRWRFDYAHIESKVAIELEGGTWVVGRHNHPASIEADMEKYNTASELGWKLIRLTPGMLDREPDRWRSVIMRCINGC